MVSRRGQGRPPALRTVDLRGLPLDAGLSGALIDALRRTVIEDGRQALLFLNRRGFAPTLQCHDCGWVAGCDHCDARLTVHQRRRQLRCHHCGAGRALAVTCPACGGTGLLTHGLGTEQAEDRLRELLPCPVHRIDSDSLRGTDAMAELLAIAASEEPCVILGTQMLTKGHHFPAVQLVGIIDADALLFSADFRGEERMAQLITQVAGRAGRASAGGRVLIQTHHPDNPLFTTLLEEGYGAVAGRLIELRRQRGLPPAGQLALLRADAPRERDAEQFLGQLRAAASELPEDAMVIGPLPSSMPRRAGRYRWQLWCLCGTREAARAATAALVAAGEGLRAPRDLNWFVDVDPSDVS
jgi:primosomal protein N' (replication factor Y)